MRAGHAHSYAQRARVRSLRRLSLPGLEMGRAPIFSRRAAALGSASTIVMAMLPSRAEGSAMLGDCDLAADARCTISGVQYELFAPSAGCSARSPCGLILDIHGYTMSGAEEVVVLFPPPL